MKLNPSSLREAEYRRSEYVVVAPEGAQIENLTDPVFWSHVAGRLRVNDRVEVHASDNTWVVEMMVRSASRAGAHLAVLHKHDFNTAENVDTFEDVEVRHRGGRWQAVRKADKAILIEGLDTKEEVVAWLKKDKARGQKMAA